MQAEFPGGEKKASQHSSEMEARVAALDARAAGAVTTAVGRIPAVGDRIRIDGLFYEVKSVHSRGRLVLKLEGS